MERAFLNIHKLVSQNAGRLFMVGMPIYLKCTLESVSISVVHSCYFLATNFPIITGYYSLITQYNYRALYIRFSFHDTAAGIANDHSQQKKAKKRKESAAATARTATTIQQLRMCNLILSTPAVMNHMCFHWRSPVALSY